MAPISIDPMVRFELDEFESEWNKRVKDFPTLMLDRTWPAVGVLDLLTFSSRGKKEFSPRDAQRVSYAAASLALLAGECWQTFGTKVKVGRTPRGIFLRGEGGSKLAPGETFTVELEMELRRLLQNPARNVSVIAGFEREVSLDHNLLSLVGLGLVSGLTPMGEGPWANETLEAFKGPIEDVVTHLAKSCVRHFERVGPENPIAQFGELYLSGLIFPPSGMNDPLPAQTAVQGVLAHRDELKLDASKLEALGRLYAQSPDELLSDLGLAMFGALSGREIPPEMLAAAESKGRYVGLLRGAALDLRAALEMPVEWIDAEENRPEDIQRFEVERRLGFLPWCYLSRDAFRERRRSENFRILLGALAAFDAPVAIKMADEIIEESPGNIEVRLQRIFLDLLMGDLDRVESGATSLMTEPGVEEEPRVHALRGAGALAREKVSEALQHFEQAYGKTAATNPVYPQIANDYVQALFLSGRFEEALEISAQVVHQSPSSISGALNEVSLLHALDRQEELVPKLIRLVTLAPTDRRVFVKAFG